jgi:hypothetical protein
MEVPDKANVHYMLWCYMFNMCGTRKARMVCDRSSRQGTITLGHTFANSLDAASERLFWAVVANKGLTTYGADVSNAFAEAPPPIHPLYMRIDEAFHDLWENCIQRPPIPPNHTVIWVQNAIQGHPESPRLWEKLIDKILWKIGFRPTTHEPCLYYGTINGSYTLFLRQVDDFAIAAKTATQANDIIARINSHLCLPIHSLGIIIRFNGMDIDQTTFFIKIHCTKYLKKMMQSHSWVQTHPKAHMALPFPSDANSLVKLIQCVPPHTQEHQQDLEKRMGFKYRHVMGEVMYPMVKCCPDISTHTILLSQHMNQPGEDHYIALWHLVAYLSHTISEGIYYWWPEPCKTLPETPLPTTHMDNYQVQQLPDSHGHQLVAYVDSDWATNTKKWTSMTGMVLMLSGGAIGYKSKFQTVIAHSSTEAEFVAPCDTAKMILFFCSLLQDIGLEQEEATVLFEDNNGALLMANAQQPTKRTRHINIKHFAILDWVEMDMLLLHDISMHDNTADAMTKPLMKQLF